MIGSAINTSSLTQTETTDYVGNVEYVNNALKRVYVGTGYIENNVYHCYLKDYLGNTRMVATPTDSMYQWLSYYPFGMLYGDRGDQGRQQMKYGGKEFDDKHGLNLYDFEARYYDPALGGFLTMDPLAEKYYSTSPYAYCLNNPMRYVDPTGMFVDDYRLQQNGMIELLERTKDDFDRLFVDNKPEIDPLIVKDKSILSDLTLDRTDYKGRYAISGNKDEMFKVFHYGAMHSDVEFRIDGYRTGSGVNEYFVGTSGSEESSAPSLNMDRFNKYDMVFNMHSHPGDKSWVGTKGASSGDTYNVRERYQNYRNTGMTHPDQWFKTDGRNTVFPKHYVFHKQSSTLYHYTPWQSNVFIRKINSPKGLYRNLGF
ncbi:RHS repeat-associated protein [Parabacteroides sp. PFB2-12]|uniref:RHS repeat domain-containing protein n=1 Tax=unclassified Parabacteroides TaxID=2649774 RepID=UPI002476E65A|nr:MULTISPECIES: RHS repeat-associated core domain-containing protein [unclassified Parabacteroides]MDH6342443.1 RHS repeat-associated protein [Parabacteroides sp. PM6-13]MDH6390095.1 RHS repeat-associated protein [Parabacteroides sp. PFB2-12]